MSNQHKFPYDWRLATNYPAAGIINHQKKVFTTFSCGGGSSMGYKLAGYHVFAANDIDPQMQKVYVANHHPEYYFLCPIKDLLTKTDWPTEFYNLDILDGSPPCSTFSMSGDREKNWGKEKQFREGQAKQVLDDLFFDFIKLAKHLQPKIIIAENVKGMLVGHAKGYVVEILKQFSDAGYHMQLFLLNAKNMGVPQSRERIFFIGFRKDLALPKLSLSFQEAPILYKEIKEIGVSDRPFSNYMLKLWQSRQRGDLAIEDSVKRMKGKSGLFSYRYLLDNKVCNTILANNNLVSFSEPRYINNKEVMRASTFPLDYNFQNMNVSYICGMSVPPVMMAQIAWQVYEQWLSKVL